MAGPRDRRSFWRSFTSVGIRPRQSHLKPATPLSSPQRASFRRIQGDPLTADFRFCLAVSDFHNPSKLIRNQNASIMNADRLKAKMTETIINTAPAAFSSEYFGDELESLSSCRSKYATTIKTTPLNPTTSNQVRLGSMWVRIR